ncbi:FAD-dependent oxidoreductase [Limnohabitans lacus]|uniref:FAD-dependent oxidoreductase n=1 Tax=Limnohabitans lacus TaxID=3045173 RepID=A0ABT6X593_9BURK|nr:FAD-dependent oxidoreductase [Limnohabitans sp. HM2-2]MDI9233295.1 FAD-dependent oxidoreductase [Limnohabitans sp. HM2-2]
MQVLKNGLDGLKDGVEFDLVVIGAGGAGLSAAVFAAIDGAKVLVVERTEFVGGTTAWSAGTTWAPGTHHAAAVNPSDKLADVTTYLNHAVGAQAPAALREAFLKHGGDAVAKIEAHSSMKYRPYPKHPDYISDLPGSTLNGRALEPVPFDGRLLGELFPLLRPPIPEFTVLGGMMVDRTDINHLLAMTKSWASLKHALSILGRHLRDRLSHARGTRLVMGNALVGRLLHGLSQHAHATLALKTSVDALERDASGRVVAVRLSSATGKARVVAKHGVVLASGGFNRDPALRAQKLPGIPADWCPAAPGHTGEALALARGLGAVEGQGAQSPAFWAPVSLRQRPDGSTAVFPHFVMDRAKPGMITVNQAGERFVNESTSYHLFALGMQAARQAVPAYMVADAKALRQYGMGMVRPGGKGLAPFLADGYLTEAASLQALADKLGISAQGLAQAVADNNAFAQTGVDTQFQRGETAYQQNIGDAAAGGRNPNLGAISEGPYYAVKLYPGDIGAAQGLQTNEHAQLLNAQGQVIEGLYAVGNDMNSIMGGVYPAPGITIGPGLVFAYLATRHALASPMALGSNP